MCEKQISTENGVLTCDKANGHAGMHHSKHGGGRIPAIDHSKTKDGDPIMRDSDRFEISWPQEGMNDPVAIKRG